MHDSQLARDLNRLSKYITIQNVHFNELSIKAEHKEEEELRPPVFRLGIVIADDSQNPDPNLAIAQVALNVELIIPEGQVCVEPVATYQIPREHSEAFNPRALTAYVNETGLLHLLPFARQALLDLSVKVFQNPIVMPILTSQDLNFEIPPIDQDSDS